MIEYKIMKEVKMTDELICSRTQREDLNWAVGLNRFTLRLMGVWPEDENPKKSSFPVVLIIPMMLVFIIFGSTLPQIVALKMCKQIPTIIYASSELISNITCIFKLYVMWKDSKALQPVIRSLISDWMRYKPDWERNIMKVEANRGRLATMIVHLVMTFSFIGFLIFPSLGIPFRPLSNVTDHRDRFLSSITYYPYDYLKSPNYELTLCMQAVVGLFLAIGLVGLDNYFAVLIFHISGQFKILGMKVESLMQSESYEKAAEITSFKRSLAIFIDRHVHLMTMLSLTEYTFSFVIFFQIISMSLLFIGCGFTILENVTNVNSEFSTILLIPLFLLGINLSGSIFVICFACELLTLYKSEIFYHIYNINWYKMPPHRKQDLIPIFMVSKAPQYVKAGHLINLSYSNYLVILKSILGYISMCIAVAKR